MVITFCCFIFIWNCIENWSWRIWWYMSCFLIIFRRFVTFYMLILSSVISLVMLFGPDAFLACICLSAFLTSIFCTGGPSLFMLTLNNSLYCVYIACFGYHFSIFFFSNNFTFICFQAACCFICHFPIVLFYLSI